MLQIQLYSHRVYCLYNTRRSGYNVKEYKNSYITTTKYPGSGSSGLGNIRFNSNESVSTYYPDRWVTKSSNNADGSGSFGRKSQRKVIVEQLKSEIDTNQAIREDQRGLQCYCYTWLSRIDLKHD